MRLTHRTERLTAHSSAQRPARGRMRPLRTTPRSAMVEVAPQSAGPSDDDGGNADNDHCFAENVMPATHRGAQRWRRWGIASVRWRTQRGRKPGGGIRFAPSTRLLNSASPPTYMRCPGSYSEVAITLACAPQTHHAVPFQPSQDPIDRRRGAFRLASGGGNGNGQRLSCERGSCPACLSPSSRRHSRRSSDCRGPVGCARSACIACIA